MLRELQFKDNLKELVLSNVKTVTSRLSTDLCVRDVFYVDDDLFVVTRVERKRIEDVDYESESFTSSHELLNVLNDIYFVNLKRIDKELTFDDVMYVVEFERVCVAR
jgi:hypothetical protein